MRRTGARLAVALLAASLALPAAGCNALAERDPRLLVGRRWVVEWMRTENATVVPGRGAGISIEFANGMVHGWSGCGEYGGPYRVVDGRAVLVASLVAPVRPTDPVLMAQQRAYLADLEAAQQYRVRGTELDLLDGVGDTLVRYRGR